MKHTIRAGLKGRGPGAIFTGGPYDVACFMTSSFVKFMFSLIRNVRVCFFQ